MPITITPTRYSELLTYTQDEELLNRVEFAIIRAAQAIKESALNDTPDTNLNTANHRLWARYVLDGQQTRKEAIRTLRLIIADNAAATDAQIEGVNDAALQVLVDNVVNGYSVQARADR